MAKDSDDTKPTLADIDRVIIDHERRNATGQGTRKAAEERDKKDQEGTKLEFARAVTRAQRQCASWRSASDEQKTVDESRQCIW